MKMLKYESKDGCITIEFDHLPSLKLKRLETQDKDCWQHLFIAGSRRYFGVADLKYEIQ